MNPKKPRRICKNGCGSYCKTPVAIYCSLKCQMSFQQRRRLELFFEGQYPPQACTIPWIRRYMIDLLGERCARCGWCEKNPSTGRVPLELEHIDGDWRNNRPANLTVLCPNCHSLTPTFKALNRGRGREDIRRFWRYRLRREKPHGDEGGAESESIESGDIRRRGSAATAPVL